MSRKGPEKRQQDQLEGEEDAMAQAFGEALIDKMSMQEVMEEMTEEEQRDKARKLFDYFVVHGKEKIENGKLKIEPFSDLDGKFSEELLRMAGFKSINKKFNPNYPEEGGLEHVEKGTVGSREGGIIFDTGNVWGIKFDPKTGKLIIDHHPIEQGVEAKNNTCAAKLIYEAFVTLGFLKADKNLEKAVEFVNQVDNRTFPLNKEDLKNYHRSLFGLAEFIEPRALIKFFKEGRDPARPLTDDEINDLDYQKGKRRQKGKDLIDRSETLKGNVERSVKLFDQLEDKGLIINSKAYGKIAVDMGGKIPPPLGFDISKAYGYGAYVSWNPKSNGFFVNTMKDFKPDHKFGQGIDMRARHMWLKPQKDKESLKVSIEDILMTLTDGELPEEDLARILEQEKIDLSGASGKINEKEISSKNMAENKFEAFLKPEKKEVGEQIEVHPFEVMEAQDVETLNKKYVKKIEITGPSKEIINGTLNADANDLRERFALQWFNDPENKQKIKDAGFPIDNLNDEYKIAFVLEHWKPEKQGGWGIGAEMRSEKYRKDFGNKIDKIQVLSADMVKDSPPQVTLLLLLNYFDKKEGDYQKELADLKAKATGGNESDKLLAAKKQEELNDLFSARKEIAGKILHENLDEMAQRTIPVGEKERYFQRFVEQGKREMTENENNRLLREAYKEFYGLTEKEKKHCLRIIEYKGEKTPEGFINGMKEYAKKYGEDAFYGLLKTGYKPHRAYGKGHWPFKTRYFIPKQGGVEEMSDDLDERTGENYAKYIEEQVNGRIEKGWEKQSERLANIAIEKRIKELARSPEQAIGNIEKLYDDARHRIIMEHIEKYLEKKAPITKARIDEIEKQFGGKGQEVNIKNVLAEVMDARLEVFSEKFKKNEMVKLLKESYGIPVSMEDVGFITPDDYAKAKKTHAGLFNLIMNVIENSIRIDESKKEKKSASIKIPPVEPGNKPEIEEKPPKPVESPKSFAELIEEGNELVESFKETRPGRENLNKFKDAVFELNKKFGEAEKYDENDKNFIEWKRKARETSIRLRKKKFDKPEAKPPEQDKIENTTESRETQEKVSGKKSIESARGEKSAEQKSSEELLLEYATVRKKWNKAEGKEKEELEKQMNDLGEQRKKAKEREEQEQREKEEKPIKPKSIAELKKELVDLDKNFPPPNYLENRENYMEKLDEWNKESKKRGDELIKKIEEASEREIQERLIKLKQESEKSKEKGEKEIKKINQEYNENAKRIKAETEKKVEDIKQRYAEKIAKLTKKKKSNKKA